MVHKDQHIRNGFVKSPGPCWGHVIEDNFPKYNESSQGLKAKSLKGTDLCKDEKC